MNDDDDIDRSDSDLAEAEFDQRDLVAEECETIAEAEAADAYYRYLKDPSFVEDPRR